MSPNILRLVQWSVIKNLSLDCNDLCYLRWFKESFSQRLSPLLLWKLLHLNLWSDWWVMNSTRDTLTSSGHRPCKLSLSKHKLQPVPVKDCPHSRRYLTACKNSLILTCKELCSASLSDVYNTVWCGFLRPEWQEKDRRSSMTYHSLSMVNVTFGTERQGPTFADFSCAQRSFVSSDIALLNKDAFCYCCSCFGCFCTTIAKELLKGCQTKPAK